MTGPLPRSWTSSLHSILRIVAGFLFVVHGTQKLFGYPPMDGAGIELFSLLGLAGVMEAVGGFLLVVGAFTRPVAAVLAAEMAVAYGMVHLPQGLFPLSNGGEPALLYGIIFLHLAFAGGGAWSLEGAMRGADDPVPRAA